jgi:hypothetical protein
VNQQLPNGGFPAYYSQSMMRHSTSESADMSAQVIRLMLILSELGEYEIDNDNTERAVRILFECQYLDGENPRAHGGFLAGPAWFKNGFKQHVNSWVTMFVLQAVHMYIQKSQNRLEINLFDLV